MSRESQLISIAKLANDGDSDAQDTVRAISFFANEVNMDLEKFRLKCNERYFDHDFEHYEEYIAQFIEISTNDKDFEELSKEYGIKHSAYATAMASHLEVNTQFQKYHNARTGHGFAAEDANALNDFLHGRSVEKIGLSNEKDGADRIVDGVAIQVKYYKSAKASVDAAFGKDGFRYAGQKLEVPKDQYDEALKEMSKRIANGEVRDGNNALVTDIDEAKNIVSQGSITYEQAKNIAKAGNIDSIVFDIKNQCISSSCTFGISFVSDYARSKWSGQSHAVALKNAFGNALQSSLASTVSGVISSQLLRTKAAAGGTVIMRSGVKVVAKSQLGKSAIEAIAKASLGRSVYGAAAVNHVSKLLRSNVATAVIATSVSTAPDFYRAAIAKNISWGQFSKNLAVNAAGVAGGAGGWFAGTATGAAIGSAVPVIGTVAGGIVGGFIGAFGGGTLAAKAAKTVADAIREDDAIQMVRLVQNQAEKKAYDFMLTEPELGKFSEYIKSNITPDWLRQMYASASDDHGRECFAGAYLGEYCDKLISQRPKIVLPDTSVLINDLDEEMKKEEEEAYIRSLHHLDPRRKVYKIKSGLTKWKKGLANKSPSEIIEELAPGAIAIGLFLWLISWGLGAWPKTTLVILGLLAIGWYNEDN